MRLESALAAALSLALVPRPVHADEVDATATSLLQARQDPRDGAVHTVVPLLELVSAKASAIDNPWVQDLSVVLSAWGGFQFGDPIDNHQATGDVDLAYVEGSGLDHKVKARLGRQLIIGGAGRITPIDGLNVTVMPTATLGVTVYGGQVVVPRFALPKGDGVAGIRAFDRISPETEVGVSFLDMLTDGRTARQDVALDARYALRQDLTLTGYGAFSALALRLSEADVAALWQPMRQLQVTADYRRTAPDLFIPASSIFSVFAQERLDEFGAMVSGRPWAHLTVWGDYHAVDSQDGWGHRAQLRGTWDVGSQRRTSVGVEGRLLSIPVNGYLEGRVFGTHHVAQNLLATLELDAYHFRNPINGQPNSFYSSATVAYDATPTWRVALSGVVGVTPYLESETQLMARLVWNPTFHFHESHR